MSIPKKSNREITDEVISLALNWANDEISLADVARELQTVNMTHTYTTLARALRQHVRNK